MTPKPKVYLGDGVYAVVRDGTLTQLKCLGITSLGPTEIAP